MKYVILLLILILTACGGVEAEEEIQKGVVEEVESSSQEQPSFKSAVVSATGDTGMEAGFIGDGDKITLPAGFAADQCVFTASLAFISGSALSQRVSVNKTTAVVTCKTIVQEREQVQPVEKSCTASYIVVCAK